MTHETRQVAEAIADYLDGTFDDNVEQFLSALVVADDTVEITTQDPDDGSQRRYLCTISEVEA